MSNTQAKVNADYYDFLAGKIADAPKRGFSVEDNDIHDILYPHQRDIVRWALAGGCRAIFAAFGLGKSFMQLEIMRQVTAHEGGRQLIICPLGVRQEFARDAATLGMDIRFIRASSEAERTTEGLFLTNYESVRDGKLDVALFNAVSLDEASVLRSFGSKTYQTFLDLFRCVKYRFVATATPSPNRYKELIHYAGFLGVMDTGEALTRFFQRDSSKAGNLTLYPHMEREFWAWVSSWAIFLQKPSDLGYSDAGYDLPALHVHYHEVCSETGYSTDRDGQLQLISNAALSLQAASREKRNSLSARVDKMLEIIGEDPESNYILWHDQESERHAIKAALPSAAEVYGSLDLEVREQRIIDFSEGRSQYLATKPILSGSGCNFQRHCHKAIFLGIGFKFNDFIQAIHRIHRFLQGKECHIHIIYANSELQVLGTLKRKWAQHDKMVGLMSEIIRKNGLSNQGMVESLKRSMGVQRTEVRGGNFVAAHNDCVVETRGMDECSVDMIVTSIPFANHYEYTPSFNDFGHTQDNNHFWRQMDFLTPELLRVLRPGRIYACHVKDRIVFGNVSGKGVPTVSPFHAETIAHGMRHGFDYMGMITVVTDVVRENNQTYRLGWSEQCKDGTKMGVGSPEYVILFRKPQTDRTRGYADVPVVKNKSEYTRARWQVDAHAFWRSSGDRLPTVEEMSRMMQDELPKVFEAHSLSSVYDYAGHIAIGEALDEKGSLSTSFMSLAPASHNDDVWHNVCRMLTLNGEQSRKGLVGHICPLQFDIVDRIINRYTNAGEIVFDPFGGLGTVPYRAILMGRKGRCCELNQDYFRDSVRYLKGADNKVNAPTLFDVLAAEKREVA